LAIDARPRIGSPLQALTLLHAVVGGLVTAKDACGRDSQSALNGSRSALPEQRNPRYRSSAGRRDHRRCQQL